MIWQSMIAPEQSSFPVIFVIFTRQTYRSKMTWSCELAVVTPQVQFELFTTTILVGRRRWWLKLKGGLKRIHIWIVGTKIFGGHNGTLMWALWTGIMVVVRQIFSNKACKVMNWKTLMLCCCFNLEAKGNVYKWEQHGLETHTRLILLPIKWSYDFIHIQSDIVLQYWIQLIFKTLEWVLDGFHLIFD
jgi:hypothetical protein